MDRMLADGRHSSGLHIGRRTHLERDLLIENVFREVAEHLAPAFVLPNVGDDRDAMTDPIRAAHLHGFPNGLAAVGLAGMNGVIRALPAQQLERFQEPRWRETALRPGDIEARDPIPA